MIWGDPIYKLGSEYLENVLHNMESSNYQLKFGETGKKGIKPRYQDLRTIIYRFSVAADDFYRE